MEIVALFFSISAILISIFPYTREFLNREKPLLNISLGWDMDFLDFHNSFFPDKKVEPPNLCFPYIQIENVGLSTAFDIKIKNGNKKYYFASSIKPGELRRYNCTTNKELFNNVFYCDILYKTQYWPLDRVIKSILKK